VDLRRHVVHAELDDRDVRRRRLEVGSDGQPGHRELRGLQRVEVAAEVDEHQIALVAEKGREGGRAIFSMGHGEESVHRRRRPLAPFAVGEGPPGLPPDPEHLMEKAPAFEGLGYAWVVHHHDARF
jgi:hypothetical protein